jgi:polygalacturonase
MASLAQNFLVWVALLLPLMLRPAVARGDAPVPEQLAPDWWRAPAASMTPVTPVVVSPPEPHFDPRTYGAKGDGMTYDTEALRKAIDACGGTGGSVILSPGKYLSAQLTLHGRMTFFVEKGAVLLGGTNAADYPVLIPDNTPARAIRRSVLYAVKADGLVIDGEGEINGQCKLVQMFGKEPERPSLVRIFQSRNVIVRNVTLRNPRMWTQVYSECENLTIDHVTVIAPPDAPNLDGMDICDSRDVTIRDCDVQSEDDSVCLKSHGSAGLQNITVENNRIRSFHANGIKLGTATVGPISHIVIRNNTVLYAKYGGLCIESVDGAAVSDVVVSGLDLYRTSQPIFVRLARRGANNPTGDLAGAERPAGSITNVMIERVRALGTHNATHASCTITGIPGARVSNVQLKDCYIEMPGGIAKAPIMPPEKEGGYPQSNIFGDTPAYCFFVRDADGIVFDHVVTGYLQPDVRPWLVKEDANVKTSDCKDIGLISPTRIP